MSILPSQPDRRTKDKACKLKSWNVKGVTPQYTLISVLYVCFDLHDQSQRTDLDAEHERVALVD